ncbi:malonic semialdehyde reductase [Stutzerimonas zhaodongensis]|uniref:Putative NADH dehydrogenase/NAD(P)H nitroreductase EA797_20820 n=1 Tax=Stutzerimonas zhaodongensis TaxID=1176257 RepID=A0A3M2HGZ0_9GAMM|nr:malonic semialdehyde reductase [Stutzerimonas zhaodongensis]MCQ4317789.1 malonic semialdehyde reductase [Stutzerimonas zhaodongensis]RMH87695.1 malonic semialdehyde reductase [Stutzerimonas zhaodongensis]
MSIPIDPQALATLFAEGRTHSAWLDKPVPDALIEQLYAQVSLGPTAVNSCPGRFVFVRTTEGKAKLAPCLSKGNLEKTMSAPVTVIVAYDEDFPETLPELFPFADARSWYAGQPALITENALRNSSLQAGYLILAARALGLDTGPMSGFDAKALDEAFFAGTTWNSNLLINLGYADASKLRDRLPRLPFDRACILA